MSAASTTECIDVSGLVVYADPHPAHRALALRDALGRIAGVIVHAASPEGKLVVTLETSSEADSVALCERIRTLDGVASVAMVYHQIENEPDKEI